MNKHTRAVLDVLKAAVDAIEVDSEALNDDLNSALSSTDPDMIDQKELRAQLVKHISGKALKTADEMIGLVQQVYGL